MSTFDREAYIEKVRKLLAKAEGAATPEEAEVFFGKAQTLISKWEIEEAELRAANDAANASWDIEFRSYPLSSYSPKQDSYAMQAVADAMGLQAFYTPYVRGVRKATTEVFGTAEDLDRFEMMWSMVNLQMIRFMKEEENPAWNRNDQRRFRLGFKVGFGKRVGERIKAARNRVTGKDCSKALVLVGKTEAIERALPDDLKDTRVAADSYGAEKGRQAAEKADINGASRVGGSKARAAVNA